MSEFGEATQVRRVGEGSFEAQIAPDWDIAGNANGGYLLAIAARAMSVAVDRPPLSITAHYLAPGRPGPATVEVDVERAGRRMATARARLRTAEGVALSVLGTFGPVGEGPRLVGDPPVELPPPDDCVRVTPPAAGSGFGERVRMLAHPDDVRFGASGERSGRAEIRGWFEFDDPADAAIDTFGLLVAADSFPPVVFNVDGVPMTWAPTLELTVHLRGVPVPGPLRCRYRSEYSQGGLFDESGEVWDAAGTLVAHSRQLALMPRP